MDMNQLVADLSAAIETDNTAKLTEIGRADWPRSPQGTGGPR
ncbi:MAG: hypothetical protein ACKVWR_12965 [Acidimicrobiales bacterium]